MNALKEYIISNEEFIEVLHCVLENQLIPIIISKVRKVNRASIHLSH